MHSERHWHWVDSQYEAHCSCGNEWRILTDIDDSPSSKAWSASRATVFDVRPLAEHHSAGRDVE